MEFIFVLLSQLPWGSKPYYQLCENKVPGEVGHGLFNSIQLLIKRSTEKRKRRSRTHPRELRSPASPYPYNNTEWFWDKEYSLN